jgi:hypothetical protein
MTVLAAFRRAIVERTATFCCMAGHIVAIGGVSPDVDDSALDRFVLELAGVAKPRVCFLPTASGDAAGYIDAFYAMFPRSVCEPTHLTLFSPPFGPPAEVFAIG